jgi:hypothetical protein
MPTKVSERNLILSIALSTIAIALLFSAKLFYAPVKISEKGLVFIVLGMIAATFAVKFFKKVAARI